MTLSNSIIRQAATAVLALALLAACGFDKPEALLASAKDYLAKNDRKAAVIQLKDALQKSPDLAEARFLLGRALLDSGDVRAAEIELRKAMELKYPVDQVAPPLARTLLLSGEFKKLTDEFSKLAVTAPEAKAELQTTLGQARLQANDHDLPGALKIVDAVLAKAPQLTEAWQFKGDVLLAQGQSDA